MRTIIKHSAPASLTGWRLPRLVSHRPPGMDCTYAEMRHAPAILSDVEDSLVAEQGGICAYTGHRIAVRPPADPTNGTRRVEFHIEHLTPQAHCAYGQDTDYNNIVGCWPRPNCGFEPKYGARRKGNWPSPSQHTMFVTPLLSSCSARFSFNHRGQIASTSSSDAAALQTINELGLDHEDLTSLRRDAIKGALNPGGRHIKLRQAQRLLAQLCRETAALDRGDSIRLMPFCFAIKAALLHEIAKLEGIMKRKAR